MNWLLSHLLLCILPRYGKRAVFLTTLTAEISKGKIIDLDTLKSINESLHIVDNGKEKALLFPLRLSSLVWKKNKIKFREIDDCDLPEEIRNISNRIINSVPDWSRYDDYEIVLKETMDLLTIGFEKQLCCG